MEIGIYDLLNKLKVFNVSQGFVQGLIEIDQWF